MKYIFRCDRSGVFFGELVEKDNKGYAKMKDSRRIRKWYGANGLDQLAVDGSARPSECLISVNVKEREVFDLIELIPCTEKAEGCLNGVKEWRL